MAAYGLEIEEQEKILDDMENTTKQMRVGNKKSLLPFQKGIIISINALKMLFRDLKDQYKISYLLTYRLNQDPLEMFFGIIRAKGGLYDHPNALQFKYRLRSIILGQNESVLSQSANVECDNTGYIKMDVNQSLLSSTDVREALNEPDVADLTENVLTASLFTDLTESERDTSSELPELTQNMGDLEYDGLEYIAGYILKRLEFKVPKILERYSEKEPSGRWTWTDTVSEGGLKQPSDEFIQNLKKLEDIFNKSNSTILKVGRNYIKNLISYSNEVELDSKIKKLFFRCKMFLKFGY